MSDPRYYTATGITVTSAQTEFTSSLRQQARGEVGGAVTRIFSGYTDEIVTVLGDNTGANSMDLAVYGFMTVDDAIADGILLATATTIGAGATGALIIGPVVGTGNVVNGYPYYGITLVSASGSTATLKVMVRGTR